MLTWLLKTRAVLLTGLILVLSRAGVGLANENLVLSVNSMPLSVFASAIEEGMSIAIEVDEPISNFTVDGQFTGSIEMLLDDLYKRYGISHTVSDNVYRLWRESDFSSLATYQFQLSDMEMVTFLNYLSQATGYSLVSDTPMNITVNGAFNGTLREIINTLSHQYPVLFHIGEDSISVLPESSFEKNAILISNKDYSPEEFLTDLRTKLPPGNFVNRQDDQLIVGGHPEFVRLTSLQIQIDMSAAASQNSELLTAQFPLVSDAVAKTQLDNISSKLPEIAVTESTLLPDPQAAAFNQGPEVGMAVLTNADISVPELLKTAADVSAAPRLNTEVAESPKPNTEVADVPRPNTEVAKSPKPSTEEAESAKVVAEPDSTPQSNGVFESVDQIPGFY